MEPLWGSCSVPFKLTWATVTSGAILPISIYYLQLPHFSTRQHFQGLADQSTWLPHCERSEEQGELMTNKIIKLIIYDLILQSQTCVIQQACKLPEYGF